MHVESVPGDDLVLRWVFAGQLPATGRLVGAPGELGPMLSQGGLIVRALCERDALWTWLAEPQWAVHGPAVRDAIAAASCDLTNWVIEPAADELLEVVAKDVIGRTLRDYISSHGGAITLLSAADDQVVVRLDGACAHCPAAGLTLHGRVEQAIRARINHQVMVSS